ncbi:hypothetical protein [Clostridium sp.]|uniref:hypothetical protein n=1 Tax=Clostridium sp. TaxID=1506 RepID=UPI003F39FD42
MKTIIGVRVKYDRNNKRRVEVRRNENGLTDKQQELQEFKIKVYELKEKGLSNRAIAKEFGCSEGKIRTVLQK